MNLHDNPDFPSTLPRLENRRRIASIMRAFKEANLIYTGPEGDVAEILKNSANPFMFWIAVREGHAADSGAPALRKSDAQAERCRCP